MVGWVFLLFFSSIQSIEAEASQVKLKVLSTFGCFHGRLLSASYAYEESTRWGVEGGLFSQLLSNGK